MVQKFRQRPPQPRQHPQRQDVQERSRRLRLGTGQRAARRGRHQRRNPPGLDRGDGCLCQEPGPPTPPGRRPGGFLQPGRRGFPPRRLDGDGFHPEPPGPADRLCDRPRLAGQVEHQRPGRRGLVRGAHQRRPQRPRKAAAPGGVRQTEGHGRNHRRARPILRGHPAGRPRQQLRRLGFLGALPQRLSPIRRGQRRLLSRRRLDDLGHPGGRSPGPAHLLRDQQDPPEIYRCRRRRDHRRVERQRHCRRHSEGRQRQPQVRRD